MEEFAGLNLLKMSLHRLTQFRVRLKKSTQQKEVCLLTHWELKIIKFL